MEEEGGFAGAVFSQKGDQCPFLNFQINTLENIRMIRGQIIGPVMQILNLDEFGHGLIISGNTSCPVIFLLSLAAMFGFFVLIRKNRCSTTKGNGLPAGAAACVKIPKSGPRAHHPPRAKYAAAAAQQSPVDPLSPQQRDLTVLLLVRRPHTKWAPCPMERAPVPWRAASSAFLALIPIQSNVFATAAS